MAQDNQAEPGEPFEFRPQFPPRLGGLSKWAVALIGLLILFFILSWLKSIYTDMLWFGELGFRSVYVKILVTRIVLFFAGAIIFGTMLAVSIYVANRLSSGPETPSLTDEAIVFLWRTVFWGTILAAGVISLIFGVIAAGRWEIFLRFGNSNSFDLPDPVYGMDLSFFVFELPVYHFVQGWLLGAFIVIIIATLVRYFINYNMRQARFEITPGMKAHISVLAAGIMIVIALAHWLDRWELLLSGHGAVFGAAYTDIHARQPALLVLTIIAAASGVLMLVNAYLRGIRLLVGAFALWVVLAIVLGAIWPSAMQQFTVNPNEFVKESQYITRNIEFTRRGFGLSAIEQQFYPAEPAVTADLITANLETISNIRLWDKRPLSDVYRQIQLIRPYYDFRDADVDRYVVDGKYRQVLLAAREVAPEKLESESQTWINRKLIYTHGFGLAMSPVTEFTPDGRPEFFAKDIPSTGEIPLRSESQTREPKTVVTNPRVYYGENTLDFVIVNTNTDELDYQTEEGDLFRTNYDGSGGVPLSSGFRRLMYAWQFRDINVLISGEIHGESLIQYRRHIQERIHTVAPFLLLDQDPYLVTADGKLFWMQDAYTSTDRYPYSDRFEQGNFNYIRNSVKVTVDAYTGDLRFHIVDPTDPIVQTYASMFPDLFVSLDAMSESMRERIRYPQDLFSAQADKYLRYHMQEPQIFYNNEDLWSIPNEKFGQGATLQPLEPYYVIMKLPGEEAEEFVLLMPYTPNNRPNMVGWLAARSDGENYGKLAAFDFPKDRQVDGPEQIEARIDIDQDISEWFTLRCQEGSFCIRGNLLVIPLGGSLLYAEPVYLQAEGVEFPELKRVILASQEKVVMEDSLQEALDALTGATGLATAPPVDGQEAVVEPSETPQAVELEDLQRLSELVEGLNVDLDSIEQALENLKQLSEALERLKELDLGE